MRRPSLPTLTGPQPAWWPRFSSRIRGEALTARLGSMLGIAFTVCFITGLLSHLQYHPLSWFPTPAMPVWGYRLTQGIHVCTGIASIPLLLAKLWSVYPKLFGWPAVGSLLTMIEPASIFVLVSTALLQLFTGFINILDWYPWPWNFVKVHYYLAYVSIGSVTLHVAVKLPIVRRGLATPLDAPAPVDESAERPTPWFVPPRPPVGNITRRGALITAAGGVGVVALTTTGQSFKPLEPIALLAPREPKKGPLGVPINRRASQVGVVDEAQAPTYRLQVVGPQPYELDLAAIRAMPRHGGHFPIACVEGWSAGADWEGLSLLALVERAGGNGESVVHVRSLQKGNTSETYSMIRGAQMRAALLATHLNGVVLPLDHGYPLRLIAPDRAGALNTKWVASIEVS